MHANSQKRPLPSGVLLRVASRNPSRTEPPQRLGPRTTNGEMGASLDRYLQLKLPCRVRDFSVGIATERCRPPVSLCLEPTPGLYNWITGHVNVLWRCYPVKSHCEAPKSPCKRDYSELNDKDGAGIWQLELEESGSGGVTPHSYRMKALS